MKNRAFAYFLSQVSSSCRNQYTKAVTLVIFRLLLTNCRDFYFQGLGLSSSILSFQLFFFASLSVFILSLSPPFFCVCVLPRLTCQSIQSQLSALNLNFNFLHCFRIIDMFSANELAEISACSLLQTKIALHEFQLPLYYSYFGITEFSLSNTGFLTLYKYFIDVVMSWFVKSCKSCLSFSYNLSVFFE